MRSLGVAILDGNEVVALLGLRILSIPVTGTHGLEEPPALVHRKKSLSQDLEDSLEPSQLALVLRYIPCIHAMAQDHVLLLLNSAVQNTLHILWMKPHV